MFQKSILHKILLFAEEVQWKRSISYRLVTYEFFVPTLTAYTIDTKQSDITIYFKGKIINRLISMLSNMLRK